MEMDHSNCTNPLPKEWGVANQKNYFHGTDVFRLNWIRRHGLQPSEAGTGAGHPKEAALYTCKNRSAPYHTYAQYHDGHHQDGAFPLSKGHAEWSYTEHKYVWKKISEIWKGF